MREIVGLQAEFSSVGHIAGTSESYVRHELDWYKSMDLCIDGHEGIGDNKVWRSCATPAGFVNSNYGWMVWSTANGRQFDRCLEALVEDPGTRQAVMVYCRPFMHDEAKDGIHARYDMPCTMYVQLLVRDRQLHMHVHMRSNDAWYGMRNDLAWQQTVFSLMLDKLRGRLDAGLGGGKVLWNCGSLHLYERNLGQAEEWLRKFESGELYE